LLVSLFLVAGFNHLKSFNNTTEYLVRADFPPQIAPIALALSLVLKIVGSLLILFNIKPVLGLLCYVVFMIPTTYLMHIRMLFHPLLDVTSYWNQHAHAIKNIGLIGALLWIIALQMSSSRSSKKQGGHKEERQEGEEKKKSKAKASPQEPKAKAKAPPQEPKAKAKAKPKKSENDSKESPKGKAKDKPKPKPKPKPKASSKQKKA